MATYGHSPSFRRRRGRRKRGRKKVFTRGMRVTLFVFFVIFLIGFFALMVRIYLINRNDGDRYRKSALSLQTYTNTVLNYQRGSIKDRNNTAMAFSVRKYNLVLEPRTLNADDKAKADTVDAIVEHFPVRREELDEVIREKPDSLYEHLDSLKELSRESVEQFKEMQKEEKDKKSGAQIQGVWFEETYTRNYPLGNVGCSLIGFMSSEDAGTYGVEQSYNDVLCGTTGREYGYFDSDMKLQRTIKEARDGNSVVLTIDANVQQIVERQIANFQKKGMGAERVAVMLMNPKNGEVLAMASDSTFDLNNPGDLGSMYTKKQIAAMDDEEKNDNLLAMWANFCIGSAYEPGSTFKPFTIAAAMDENLIGDNSVFTCKGVVEVADRKIHCSNRSGHNALDLRHSLMESCNLALIAIGQKLGRDNFYKYNELFGFGQQTGIDLPGEASGLIHDRDQLNPVELATSSFGQTQTVTMVQMLSGFCSLVNGGDYYQPHIVKEIQNSSGDVVESVSPVVVKKTVSEDTSERLRSYLKSTVEEGTAAPAKVKGYSIGGKTGTAEKENRNKDKYLVSFIGCIPAEDPEVAIYVIIDEPHAKEQDHSSYATEFASKIMKKVLPFLGLYSSKE